jgi:hypothetical protein
MNAVTQARHIFIQDCQTRMLLDPDNQWTVDSERARDFRTTFNAVAHALAHRLARAQMLIRFGDTSARDVEVPLSCDVPHRLQS